MFGCTVTFSAVRSVSLTHAHAHIVVVVVREWEVLVGDGALRGKKGRGDRDTGGLLQRAWKGL